MSLNPGYDPGPITALSDPESLRSFLQVDDKKIVLKKYIRSSTPAKPRLLDIGCGPGGYLLAGSELGFDVCGLEPSADHSRIAREELGFPVQTAYFSRGLFPPSSFDVIMMSHVIEHIYDPKAFLADVVDLLAPGGVLVVVTPNAGSPIAWFTHSQWVMLRTVDHVSLMSEKSLRFLGVQHLGDVVFSGSEYPWEPAASLLSSAAALITSRTDQAEASQGASPSPPRTAGRLVWMRQLAPVRLALTVLSFPMHAASMLLNRQACLTMEIWKRT